MTQYVSGYTERNLHRIELFDKILVKSGFIRRRNFLQFHDEDDDHDHEIDRHFIIR